MGGKFVWATLKINFGTPFINDIFTWFVFHNEWHGICQFCRWRHSLLCTAWQVCVFGVFLVRIFSHSAWIRRDTEHLSLFGRNAEKYGPENLQIWALFPQCYRLRHTWCYIKITNTSKTIFQLVNDSQIIIILFAKVNITVEKQKISSIAKVKKF